MPPPLLDQLYREYCLARLAEMRKQLWLWPHSHDVPRARQSTVAAALDNLTGYQRRVEQLGDRLRVQIDLRN
jgi:hypothetical protein